ncbi:hypothetical protein [Mitsuaria sp. GD03876]|uniref:hypothetical protein n=1 Tax=Mitsuaria sp. GD03876 TaxID=2975399 RepID=UPI00244D6D0D|nr:hypothetical protein [Mitsuaria sp. GD03876]MDH0864557.1 hypothetical protein [Mitsuaria sp. GD03876]
MWRPTLYRHASKQGPGEDVVRWTTWWLAAAGAVLGALAAVLVFFSGHEASSASDAATSAVSDTAASRNFPAGRPAALPSSDAASTPAPAPATNASLSPALRWDRAFAQARQTNIRVAAHQAAISGALIDAVAVEQARQRCSRLDLEFRTAVHLHKDQVTDTMKQAFKRTAQACEGFGELRFRPLYGIKDDGGFGELAADLHAGRGLMRDAARRERLLQQVIETKSIELLDHMRTMLDIPAMAPFGLQPATELPAIIDRALLQLAVQLRACNQRGDCDRVAQENFQCLDYNACVSDLNRFPEERMFGSVSQQAFLFKITPEPLDQAALRKRWDEIQAAVARIGG